MRKALLILLVAAGTALFGCGQAGTETDPATDSASAESTVIDGSVDISDTAETAQAAEDQTAEQTKAEPTEAEPSESEQTASEPEIILGDEQFDEYIPLLEGKRIALFSNHTGIVGDEITGNEYGEHILDALIEKGIDVTAVFSPEHGFRGDADAGEGVGGSVDEKTGVPILSLYSGNSRSPSHQDMERFDMLVVDIQDVGLRYYTYYISMYYLMDACAKEGKEVCILDRPNPNGFYVDGPILRDEFSSGVGMLPIPIVHGLTLGELARMISGEGWLTAGKDACDLTVIPCRNYTHKSKTALIMRPSPNLKDMRAVYLYASTCFFENTAVSEGRGTDFPFEVYGSPLLKDNEAYSFTFTPRSMDGALNPRFEGKVCFGVDLREVPLEKIWSDGINLDYLIGAYRAVTETSPGIDFWGKPDNGRYWIDMLSGSDDLRTMIEEGKSAGEIKQSWQEEIEAFKQRRKPYLLYEE